MTWDFDTGASSAGEGAAVPATGYLQRWSSGYELPDARSTTGSSQLWGPFRYGSHRLFGTVLQCTSPSPDQNGRVPPNARPISPWARQEDHVAYGTVPSMPDGACAPIGAAAGMNTPGLKTSSPSSSPAPSASPPQRTYSAVVQKNSRPSKGKKKNGRNSQKRYTATLPFCCAAPKIRFICDCCNEEASIQINEEEQQEELRPRVMPVATSQLPFCRFCMVNGVEKALYTSHNLRTDDGKVSCPVLREYRCPICKNKGGDFAHTIKYCPMNLKRTPT